MKDYFLNDRDLEEALMKTYLLFLNNKIKDKRDSILSKYIFALVLSKNVFSISGIKQYFETKRKDVSIEIDKIKAIVIDLKKQGLVHVNDDELSILKKTGETVTVKRSRLLQF